MTREDRLQIQTDLSSNLVIEAGAGTGKTTALIDRLCTSVLVQQIPVEKLVALTFTEKAAAEIKTRFIFKLQQLLQAINTHSQDRTLDLLHEHFTIPDSMLLDRAQKTLSQLDKACIGTIHSFCAEILKIFPLEAGLSPNAKIDSGYQELQIFERYWTQFLDDELGTPATQAQAWKRVLTHLSLQDLKEFTQQLARLKPVEYDYYSHRSFLIQLCTQKMARLNQLYQLYTPGKPRNLEKALLWASDSLQRTQKFLEGSAVPPPPQPDCPALPAAPQKGWEETDFNEAKNLIGFAQKVTPENQAVFLEAYRLVTPIAHKIHQTYLEEGIVTFDDLIIKTRNLVAANLYVRRLLKEKFEILFVDEFQDTDPIQGELLLFLAEQKAGTATRWQEVRLQPGKLIVVGDPKQSIYRFRGADITAYELFTDLILRQGGKKYFLRNNFRSESEIIQTANLVCSHVMIQEPAFQPAYEPIFTQKGPSCQAVEWLFVSSTNEKKPPADDYRHNQAEMIAQWIKQQVGHLKLQNGKLLSYQDIAILTRVGTTSSIYTEALRRHAIAFNTETEKDFFQNQEINDLLLLLRAITDPEDKIALAGVLRSPLVGLTDEQLYQLAQQNKLSWDELAHYPDTKTITAQIKHFSQLAGTIPLGELVEKILDDTFLLPACTAAYEAEQTIGRLRQFVSLAHQYEQTGNSLTSFLSQIQTLLSDQASTLFSNATQEAADAVSFLTIHKSKGLEFPVVILADLSRKENTSAPAEKHLFSWQHNMYGLRIGPICDVNLAFLEEEQKKHSRCEEVRVLYVALTRAKEKLLLVGDDREGSIKAAAPFANVNLFPDAIKMHLSATDNNLCLPVTYQTYTAPNRFLYNHAPTASLQKNQINGVSQWAASYSAREKAYQQMLANNGKHTPSHLALSSPLTAEQRQGAELGTLCHEALAAMLAQPQANLADICMRVAKASGDATQAKQMLALLQPFVNSPIFREIKACELLACEMPFTVSLPNAYTQTGVMDAVLKTPRYVWIIDYKTDKIEPGQEKLLFEQKYRLQLEEYRKAAEKIFPDRSVRASAVFVRTFAAIEA